MTFTTVLHVAALLLLQGDFPGAGSETITLQEGEDLNLRCTLSGDSRAIRQWLNPRGFTIFLDNRWALKDPRYKLTRYSEDELSVRLSNVTVHDEGIYKCFYYSTPFKSKMTTVEVLAAPSNPVLQVSRDAEGSITLSCYTQGCKPQPQVTWLLDNGIQLPGDTRHKLEANGKKWTTTSTLTVLAYGPNSTASCLVHHKALRGGKLTAPFQFEDVARTVTNTTPDSTTLEVDTYVSEYVQPTVTTAESDLNSSTDFPPTYPQHNGPGATTSAAAGELSATSARHIPNSTETALNATATEQLFRTEASFPSKNVTLISNSTSEQDVKSEGMSKKEKDFLLPLLVAVLIVVLLIIVVLFTWKLKKAHGVWKRENDTSDQTLESYKSRSNEESPGHEKSRQVVNQKSNVQYVTEGYVEATQKNPSEKNTTIPEEQFACGKETDV
ncbi:cytotoxic and regulatory T-cell molecule isoform X1 [Tympanuchus pallidicinctus]|uniref:cytotoxic and regulatory T-cell molecule isoform X1 n=1 Tax=Tympanuchus pallidicinctus TaxID=109042 RepID=UPI002286D282|nr:cytotoxic and regulatory T-cell molecule isoform X1 [Tympanuchus pallidicinctus]